MAARARTYWTSDRVHGPAGRFRVVVTRLAAGGGNPRDSFSASLMRSESEADEPVESNFWQSSTPPHDQDKIAFRERARQAATPEKE